MNRKTFIKNSAFGALGLGISSKATNLNRPSPTANPTGVTITRVTPYVLKRAIFVKIESSEGVSGWGECDSDYPALISQVISRICIPELIGKDPFQSEALWNQMYFKGYDAGNVGLLPGAIAGIDNALWDLKGKLVKQPVHRLLGGANTEKIKVYGSFGRNKGGRNQTPEELAKVALGFVERGYTTIKVRMQIRQLNVDPDPDPTFEVVKAVRKAIGDQVGLYVDFNNGYTPAKAIGITKKLIEHFNIAAIEEPVSQQNYRDLRQVVEAVDVPVMAGEHEYNKWVMRDLILEANIDVVNADVIKCGGITECKKVAAIAQAFDKPIMTHNTRPTLATGANLQFVASIGNASRLQEYGGKRERLGLHTLFENYFEFKDGYLHVPQDPGFGLVPIEKAIKKATL
ncbi:MAG: mandelate racemase/muconate lactonizing enzyme family protein [Cyclobacteriaceae bacterium]|nr:mandelate racemase/muconate lactonizing enzyme family protein [Cyclobacteriaceae bacterium HetDA_MAG_MS6]